MSPQKQLQRLRFVHLGWLGMVLAVALSVLVSSEKESLSFAWLGLAALPGLTGYALLGRDRVLNQFAPSFLVITWTVFAAFALALSGAAMSPLAVLFVIAPLVALNLGSSAMAAEASVFGAGAYFVAILLSEIGILPPGEAVPGFASVARLLAFAALVISALLIWFLARGQERLQTAADRTEPVEASVSHPPRATIPVPAGSGVLLLDVTLDGMVRGADGDRMGLPIIGVGTWLRDILENADAATGLQARIAVSGETKLRSGRTVTFCSTPYEGGTHVVLIDQSTAPAEASDAETRADAAVKQRTAFFASLGHDLKTPLNAIIGYADMMRQNVLGPLPDAYKDYPAIIHDSGEELLLMVEDMLDLARADADRQRLEPEPIDLRASAKGVIRQLENQAERAGVTLRLKAGDDDVWAQADGRAVRQIWQNLVSNAIKYSDRDGVVVLDVQNQSHAVILSVTDKGAGMSEDDVKLALEPFSQGENARGVKGTGLGLAVVKRFAELHGGQVEIRSKPGKGTRVAVTLPRAPEADADPET